MVQKVHTEMVQKVHAEMVQKVHTEVVQKVHTEMVQKVYTEIDFTLCGVSSTRGKCRKARQDPKQRHSLA